MSHVRYDGVAEWYEGFRPALTRDELDALQLLLGTGDGRCLDVGCGTGVSTAAVAELGWSAVGVDLSEDMLEVARGRGLEVVDFSAVIRETARALRPKAPVVYIGAHPCFVGPHSLFVGAEGVPKLHRGYRPSRRYDSSVPGVANPDGLRARVGGVHLPLDVFLSAFLGAGLRIERFEELGDQEYPYVVALRARR